MGQAAIPCCGYTFGIGSLLEEPAIGHEGSKNSDDIEQMIIPHERDSTRTRDTIWRCGGIFASIATEDRHSLRYALTFRYRTMK